MENKHTHFKKQPKLILAGLCFEFSKIKKNTYISEQTPKLIAADLCFISTQVERQTQTHFKTKAKLIAVDLCR